MVEDKDIMLAILGGSLGLASLLLVFLGFALSVHVSLSARDQPPKKTLRRLAETIWATIGAVGLGLAVGALALTWLLGWGSVEVTVGFFFALMALVMAVAGWTTRVLT